MDQLRTGRGPLAARMPATSKNACPAPTTACRSGFKTRRLMRCSCCGSDASALLTDDVDLAGTRTLHDDGSADYRLTENGSKLTLHTDPAGLLTSADTTGDGIHMTLTYAYGPQHLTLPARAATISAATMEHGLAYLDMAAEVRQLAGDTATGALRASCGARACIG
jgi:hypothetical protein